MNCPHCGRITTRLQLNRAGACSHCVTEAEERALNDYCDEKASYDFGTGQCMTCGKNIPVREGKYCPYCKKIAGLKK